MEALLEKLELRIRTLLKQHSQLQQLHQYLQQKNQGTISQIEQMISRLKSVEKTGI